MRDLRVAAAQFEHHDADKDFNLGQIEGLARLAAEKGAGIVSLHECSITGYTFLQALARAELAALAEPVPDGPSTRRLMQLAKEYRLVIMAGLIEAVGDKLFKCYVAVGEQGFIAKFHKLHPFIHPGISAGQSLQVIDLLGVKASCLVCYDNNLPENVRAATLMGAEVIFMPHVTGGTASVMPGRGPIDPALWENRHRDPARLRMEFDGPKGRAWMMKFLPARAWENGVYAVFSNAVGRDYDTIKPGNAMILDPYGDVVAECRELGPGLAVGLLTAEKYENAPGRRYLRARRPELYGKLAEPLGPGQPGQTQPGWSRQFDRRA